MNISACKNTFVCLDPPASILNLRTEREKNVEDSSGNWVYTELLRTGITLEDMDSSWLCANSTNHRCQDFHTLMGGPQKMCQSFFPESIMNLESENMISVSSDSNICITPGEPDEDFSAAKAKLSGASPDGGFSEPEYRDLLYTCGSCPWWHWWHIFLIVIAVVVLVGAITGGVLFKKGRTVFDYSSSMS